MPSSPDSHELLPALLQRLDSLIQEMQSLTPAINALAKSNAQIADALLAETQEGGTLDVPEVITL